MKKINSDTLKKYFGFLLSKYNFNIKKIDIYNYALYVKFLSSAVGIYLIYEFRDSIPRIQFTKMISNDFEFRPGLFTIKEYYKEDNFKLHSFYLDEIILYSKGLEYESYFIDVKSIDDVIKISAELIEKYASDFIIDDNECYDKMNVWFKNQVLSSP